MYGNGKSDRPIVPRKPTNNSGHGEAVLRSVQPLAEPVEGRGRAEGNSRRMPGAGHRAGAPCRTSCADTAGSGSVWPS